MQFDRGDVVLLAFPFSSATGAKQRPALVLFDCGDQDLLVARVTTQPRQSAFDIPLQDWKEAGLLAPSAVRLHKLATIEKNLVRRKLGRTSAGDWTAALQCLRNKVFES